MPSKQENIKNEPVLRPLEDDGLFPPTEWNSIINVKGPVYKEEKENGK